MDITDLCKGKKIKKEIKRSQNIDNVFKEILDKEKKALSKLAVRVICQLHFKEIEGLCKGNQSQDLQKALDRSATIQRDTLALKVFGYASLFFTKTLPPFSLLTTAIYWVNSGLWLALTVKSQCLRQKHG